MVARVQIHAGGLDRGVAEELAQGLEIDASAQGVGGEGVPERVGAVAHGAGALEHGL
jgi:hypothetical protein